MLKKATAHIPNVELLDGSEYVISQLSFPSYFIKKADEISQSQAEIDLDIFCRHIAPALGCARRFVGTEPTNKFSNVFNMLNRIYLTLSYCHWLIFFHYFLLFLLETSVSSKNQFS